MVQNFSWNGLLRFGGAIVGIVLTAIGAVMFINTALKVYVFGFETNSYFNPQEICDPSYAGIVKSEPPITGTGSSAEVKKTQKEIDDCIVKRTEQEKKSFLFQQKDTLINGIAFLVVGIFFWVLHRRNKKIED